MFIQRFEMPLRINDRRNMIYLQLTRREVEHGPLPSVCVRCGAPAFIWRTRRMRPHRPEILALYYGGIPAFIALWTFLVFTWRPGDDELLEMIIWFAITLAMAANVFAPWVMGMGLRVRLPFCERHHLHWFKYTLYNLICPLFLVSLIFGCFALRRYQGLLFGLMWLHLLQWLIVKTVMWHRAIHVHDCTDRHVTLRGIHVRFREALYHSRGEVKAAERAQKADPQPAEAPVGAAPDDVAM
jgi:hypothetical protein